MRLVDDVASAAAMISQHHHRRRRRKTQTLTSSKVSLSFRATPKLLLFFSSYFAAAVALCLCVAGGTNLVWRVVVAVALAGISHFGGHQQVSPPLDWRQIKEWPMERDEGGRLLSQRPLLLLCASVSE